MSRKNQRDRETESSFDAGVKIGKLPTQSLGKVASDRSFSRAHKPGENDPLNVAWIAFTDPREFSPRDR